MANKDNVWEISIRERKNLVWQGRGWALSSTNEIGPFDILEGHAQFVSLIRDYIIVHQSGEDKKFVINNAILRVSSGKIEVWMRG